MDMRGLNAHSIKLGSSNFIPTIGVGTYKLTGEEMKNVIDTSVTTGYTHFDCAYLYKNEEHVGKQFKNLFENNIIKRSDIFVTSKLWNTFHRPENVIKGCQISLNQLQLNYLDLYLIHWPVSYKPIEPNTSYNAETPVEFDNVKLEDTWKAMESLVHQGTCRMIGVSNFNITQIKRILKICQIKPAMLQIESHVYFPNQQLIDYAHSNGIAVTAYSPLGCPYRKINAESMCLIEEPIVKAIADKHFKTPGQVLLRHAIQRGLVVIPKSRTPSRIIENFQIFDFQLTEDEMNLLKQLENKNRLIKAEPMKGHEEFPFFDDP